MVGWGSGRGSARIIRPAFGGTFFLAAWGDRKNEQWGRSLGFRVEPIGQPCRIRSAPRWAIIMVGAFVFPDVSVGITDASAIRRPAMPRRRRSGSTTVPIAQVPTA